MLWIEASQHGWLNVVSIIGQMMPELVAPLGRRLSCLIASGPPMVVIDLSRLDAGSTELFPLLFLERCKALGRHGELVVAGAQGSTLMAAYAAYTINNIPLFPNVTEALGSLTQPQALTQPTAQ